MPYLTPAEAIAIVTTLAVAVFALAMCVRIDSDPPPLVADDDISPLPTLRSSPAPFDWSTDETIGR